MATLLTDTYTVDLKIEEIGYRDNASHLKIVKENPWVQTNPDTERISARSNLLFQMHKLWCAGENKLLILYDGLMCTKRTGHFHSSR